MAELGAMVEEALLEVKDLEVQFDTDMGVLKAVDGISFTVNSGEAISLVGESGSGKTMTALAIMKLVPRPGKIVGGSVTLTDGTGNIIEKPEREMRMIRGGKISVSFQDPFTYLNPIMKVGEQIREAILLHQHVGKEEAKAQAVSLMKDVGIQSAEDRYHAYPHQLSGGMRQRILLAIAISCRPKLLIADEPTTALDVIAQDEILGLLREIKAKFNTSLLLITHDLAIASEICDRLVIMYAGKVMEEGPADKIFAKPMHPYTEALLASLPRVRQKMDHLNVIQGSIPSLIDLPSGCRFHTRCPFAIDQCSKVEPEPVKVGENHYSACIRAEELYAVAKNEASG
jgi:peptide/nickel transport system ATP-binding protein